jgi:hypothetical protein
MSMQSQNGTAFNGYTPGGGRTPELQRSNRRVGLVVAIIAIFLVIFTFVYVTWFGGSNIEPREPFHSALPALQHGMTA